MNKSVSEVQSAASGSPMDDDRAFRRVLGNYVTGVTVVTASDGLRHVGVTANSFASVSLNPPLVLWSIDRKSTSFDTFLTASHFAVNILGEAQGEISSKFARTSDDKFEGVDWTAGLGGAPLVEGAVAQLECARELEYDGGDHLIMVGRVVNYTSFEREPLVFARGRYAMAVDRPPSTTSRAGLATNPSESTLLQSLLRAYEGISNRFERHREAEGLSLNQSRVLALLDRGKADSIAFIMSGALLGQRAAEDSLANLIERDLAEQAPSGEYRITDSGRERSARIRQELHKVEEEVVAQVPDLDIESTRRWLAALARVALEPDSSR